MQMKNFLVALEVDKKSVTYKGHVIEIQLRYIYVRKGGDDKENLKLCNFVKK